MLKSHDRDVANRRIRDCSHYTFYPTILLSNGLEKVLRGLTHASIAARRVSRWTANGAVSTSRSAEPEGAVTAVASTADPRPTSTVLTAHDGTTASTDRVRAVHHVGSTSKRASVTAQHDGRVATV